MDSAQVDENLQEFNHTGLKSDQPNALLVLGMHRSGTSMLARTLGLLGCKLPTHPMGPASDNRTGFWEPTSIVRVHDELLDSLGIAHDFPIDEQIGGRDIVEMISAQGPVTVWVDRLAECVEQEYGEVGHDQCLVIKDPRMCRLVPLWIKVIESLGRTPAAVMPIRNPVEVACSLSERNQFPRGKSYWLWMDHVLRAEYNTRSMPRIFIGYDELVQDWYPVLDRVRDVLQLDLTFAESKKSVDQLISAEHRHHIAQQDSLQQLPDLVCEVFELIRSYSVSGKQINTEHLDALCQAFDQNRKLGADWLLHAEQQLNSFSSSNSRLTTENARLRTTIDRRAIEHKGALESHAATSRELRSQIVSLQTQIENERQRAQKSAAESQEIVRTSERLKNDLRTTQDQLKAIQEAKKRSEEQLVAERASADQMHSIQRDEIRSLRLKAQEHESRLKNMGQIQDAHRLAVLEQKRLNAYIDSVHQSGSWRITKPVRGLSIATKTALTKSKYTVARALERFGKIVKHALPLSGSMQDRLESLFFSITKPLLKNTVGYSNYESKRLRNQRRKSSSLIEPAPVQSEVRQNAICQNFDALVQEYDVDRVPEAMIFFGVIDWHFRHQRPQHIASGMANRGHRVFYLSPQFVNQATPGYVAEQIEESESAEGSAAVIQVRLHVQGSPLIYEGALTKAQSDQIRSGISKMLIDFGVGQSVSMIQHPGWSPFAYDIPNGMLVYDCMDNHHGFADSGKALETLEERLLRNADLTIVTSDWLQEYAEPHAKKTAMVRNACEYNHFAHVDRSDPLTGMEGIRDDQTVIGYYGAIAEWFDVQLVVRVAQQYPDAVILLIGADSCGVGEQFRKHPNIRMLGEIPYKELPAYVARMDVCMIPFVINDLIRATNPVKIYEMLAAGKPVVTTDMPELRESELNGLIHRAETHHQFVEKVGLAISEIEDQDIVQRRQHYAEGHDWSARSIILDQELEELRSACGSESLVSIVVVTWNNLDLTKSCVESVLADTSYTNIELVIVDNASTDDTPEYLRDLDAREERVRVILNDENTGFSRGNNIGLHASSGNYVVLLNNDTVVTHGWIRTMVNHLDRDSSIGILGVITNNIGNEARVQTQYKVIEDMHPEAFVLTRRGLGDIFDIPVVAFFCCGMRREVYEQVGDLDENYGLGFFEDDDYCQRVREIGLRVCCANDIFVHHHLSASFNKIGSSRKDQLFKKNKEYYESKWGAWVPHCERGDPGAVKATAR